MGLVQEGMSWSSMVSTVHQAEGQYDTPVATLEG